MATSPRRVPLALKLTMLLLGVSLVPLMAASVLNLRRGVETVESTALRNLQLLARVTATRLDQLLVGTSQLQQLVAQDDAIVGLCNAAPTERDAWLPLVQEKLNTLVATNPDVASSFVTDADGVGLVSTNPKNVGMDLTFREYWQRGKAGDTYVSQILVGKTSGRPGIYFSGPVRDADGAITGVHVVKLQGESVHEIIDSVSVRGDRGYAILTDSDSIVLAHPDKSLLYHSVATLGDERIKAIDPEVRYGTPTVSSLELEDLRGPLTSDRVAGSTSFYDEPTDETMIVGFAPMNRRAWMVSILQPRSDFDTPLQALQRAALFIALAIGLLSLLVGLWQARAIVRPIEKLKAASVLIAGGDLSARAEVSTHDEIADLANSFNSMVPKLEERARMRDALLLAAEIQENLLPAAAPDVPGLDIAGINIPADETGGDYFDYLTTGSPDQVAIVVGDVTGHGVAAALLMATARALLRGQMTSDLPLAARMQHVNVRLCEDTPVNRFMTLVYLVLDRATRSVTLVNAGHDPVLVYNAERDDFDELEGDDLALGIDEDWEFTESTRTDIPVGSLLVFTSDGVWEAMNDRNEMFGKERVRAIVREMHAGPAQAIVDRLIADVAQHRGDLPQDDDITIVVARLSA